MNDAYGLIYALSQFVSPIVGSQLYTYFGARVTCDYVALLNFGFFVVLFLFNCGPFVFSENRQF